MRQNLVPADGFAYTDSQLSVWIMSVSKEFIHTDGEPDAAQSSWREKATQAVLMVVAIAGLPLLVLGVSEIFVALPLGARLVALAVYTAVLAMLEQEGFAVSGEADTPQAALTHPGLAAARVVLLDLTLKRANGLDLIPLLCQRGLRVVVYSMHEDDAVVAPGDPRHR